MNIGFDFDGVIVDTGEAKAKRVKYLHGLSVPGSMCRRTFMVGEEPHQIPLRDYETVSRDIYTRPIIGTRLRPVRGAVAGLQQLLREGHSIVVITSRSVNISAPIAQRWISKKGLQLKVVAVGKGNPDKSKAAVDNNLDAYVDNDPMKLALLRGIVPHLFLFTWEHNQYENVGQVMTRVSDWLELLDRLHILAVKMRKLA